MTLRKRMSIIVLAGALALLGGGIALFSFDESGKRFSPTSSDPSPPKQMTPNDNKPAVGDTRESLPVKRPSLSKNSSTAQTNTPSPYKANRDLTPFATHYQDWVAAAKNGDIDAAIRLYDFLSECARTPRTLEKLDDFENYVLATDDGRGNDPASLEYSRRILEEQFSACSQRTATEVASYRDWLALAARKGDPVSKLLYVRWGKPDPNSNTFYRDSLEFDQTAKKYLSEELAANNPDALFTASLSYSRDGLFTPDVVQQYAYLYAYVLAKNINQGSYFQHLQMLEASMTPSDRAQAVVKGEVIYRSCCAH